MSQIALAPVAQHYRDVFERVTEPRSSGRTRRAAALARFAELGFPNARDEAWKYTNLRRLESRRFAPADTSDVTALQSLPPSFAGQRIVVENGRIRTDLSATRAAELAGFELTTLA